MNGLSINFQQPVHQPRNSGTQVLFDWVADRSLFTSITRNHTDSRELRIQKVIKLMT